MAQVKIPTIRIVFIPQPEDMNNAFARYEDQAWTPITQESDFGVAKINDDLNDLLSKSVESVMMI